MVTSKEFRKLINENIHNLQKLINDYTDGKFYLSQRQLDEIIKLRGERLYPVPKNRYRGVKW